MKKIIKPVLNEQQEHYKSLIELFKYSVTMVIGLITFAGFILGFITYQNGEEMKTSLKNERDELKNNVAEMKADLKDKEASMQQSIIDLMNSTREDVGTIKIRAVSQIENIKEEATTIAKNEARNRIEKVFNDNNFDEVIVGIAENKIEPKIKVMVDKKWQTLEEEEVKEIKSNIDISINNLLSENLNTLSISIDYLDENFKHLTKENIVKIFQLMPLIEDFDSQASVCNLLTETRYDFITNFFKQVLVNQEVETEKGKSYLLNVNSMYRHYAIGYFIQPDFNQDFNLFLQALTTSIYPEQMYLQMIRDSRHTNPKLIFDILNSKQLVDYTFEVTEEKYWNELKEGVEAQLSFMNKADEFKATYFYRKKR